MAVTPPSLVTSGYFRVHLYVLMGLNVLASMVAWSDTSLNLWPAVTAAILGYVGSVVWLYEKPRAGIVILILLSGVTLWGAVLTTRFPEGITGLGNLVVLADVVSSSMLLGVTIAAMFLGHWYLNSPTMELVPLRRLIRFMVVCVILRMLFTATGLVTDPWENVPWANGAQMFVLLRWLSGLFGTLIVSVMAWRTLMVPNTQAATGILYVGVILAFLGELTALMLPIETFFRLVK